MDNDVFSMYTVYIHVFSMYHIHEQSYYIVHVHVLVGVVVLSCLV